MVTQKTKDIAKILENIGRQKILLAELIRGAPIPTREKEELYAAAIKDQFCFVFTQCPEITF